MNLPPPPAAWAHLPFFRQDLPRLQARLSSETREVLPPASMVFAALDLTPPEDVRVVILGQDPYPTPGHAHGLAFSVEPGVRPLPRSLGNIFKEMTADLGAAPLHGDLRAWARQGVLLLNTVLSVPAGAANAHARLGWQTLAHQVIAEVSRRPTAFVFWGKQAQALAPLVSEPKTGGNGGSAHLILETAHPSPLSARRGFFGSRPFSRINTWLAEQGAAEINWIDT